MILIIAGPSASGKTTVANWIMKKYPQQFSYSISCTTRQRRVGEVEGKDYYYISQEEFKRKIDAGEFLEWNEVYPGIFYGTLKSEVSRIEGEGKNLLLVLDVYGATNIPGATLIGILPPDPIEDTVRSRLELRGDTPEDAIPDRVAKAIEEVDWMKAHFDHIVTNDILVKTLKEVDRIIQGK